MRFGGSWICEDVIMCHLPPRVSASARFQAKKQAALGFQPSTQIADAAAKVPSLTTLSPRKLARSPINESVAMDMDFIGATTAETNPALALTHAGTRPTSVAMSSTSALAATTSSATSLSQQDLLVERARLLNTTFLQDVCFFVDSFHHIFLSEKHRKTLKANKVGLTEDGRSFVVYLVPEVWWCACNGGIS